MLQIYDNLAHRGGVCVQGWRRFGGFDAVGQLRDVQSFIDLSGKVRTPQALSHLLDQITREMDFDYYALVHHVDIRAKDTNTALWLENYPRSWAEVFIATGPYAGPEARDDQRMYRRCRRRYNVSRGRCSRLDAWALT